MTLESNQLQNSPDIENALNFSKIFWDSISNISEDGQLGATPDEIVDKVQEAIKNGQLRSLPSQILAGALIRGLSTVIRENIEDIMQSSGTRSIIRDGDRFYCKKSPKSV